MILAGILLFSVCGFAGYEVTQGRQVIESGDQLTKSGIKNAEIKFTAEELDKAFGGKVGSISITELPEATKGALKLGDDDVILYRSIARNQIGKLRFIPAMEFTGTTYVCISALDNKSNLMKTAMIALAVSPADNRAPSIKGTSVETRRNLMITGSFDVEDPEGDAVSLTLTTAPKNGTVELTGDGGFTYTPLTGKTGKDSFTVQAMDSFGNLSESAKASVTISKPASDLLYEDMKGSPMHLAAITLAERGIIQGETLGDKSFFRPQSSVTRGEFLVMVMRCTDLIGEVPTVSNTGFSDDADIPTWMKGYVKTAQLCGVISGNDDDGVLSFAPDRLITRAEAAVMLNNALALQPDEDALATVFADNDSIPTWAVSAFQNLRVNGIVNGYGDNTQRPAETLNRGQAASMLYNTMKFEQSQEDSGGFFSWLFGK